MLVQVVVSVDVARVEGAEDVDLANYTAAGVGMVRSIMEKANEDRIEVTAGWGCEEWAVDLLDVDKID